MFKLSKKKKSSLFSFAIVLITQQKKRSWFVCLLLIKLFCWLLPERMSDFAVDDATATFCPPTSNIRLKNPLLQVG